MFAHEQDAHPLAAGPTHEYLFGDDCMPALAAVILIRQALQHCAPFASVARGGTIAPDELRAAARLQEKGRQITGVISGPF